MCYLHQIVKVVGSCYRPNQDARRRKREKGDYYSGRTLYPNLSHVVQLAERQPCPCSVLEEELRAPRRKSRHFFGQLSIPRRVQLLEGNYMVIPTGFEPIFAG